ncbi:hypothetical protein [uncultured Gammaproteobacteria bacterium]|nr:hypothetical protein [uncultured Gammaproteobacteria bacterium]
MRMLDISPYYWEKMVLTMGSTLQCDDYPLSVQ